jgi:dTMP kinase
MARGRFISLEGGEGGGKSTQADRLCALLGAARIPFLRTREPGGTAGAEAIRALLVEGAPERWTPWSEALLNYAARQDHVAGAIEPALARGDWVITDRFADSTVVYQGVAQGLGADRIAALHRLVLGDLWPDLTLIFDVPADVGLRRAAERRGAGHRYERMGPEFHERVRQGFLDIAGHQPQRCIVIDAAQPIDVVTDAVRAALATRLGVRL